MARRRQETVRERLADLRNMASGLHGSKSQQLHMLTILKENPAVTFDEISMLVGRPTQTLKRWWRIYCREGIDSLLQRSVKRSQSGGDVCIAAVKEKFNANEFTNAAIRRWLDEKDHPPQSIDVDAGCLEVDLPGIGMKMLGYENNSVADHIRDVSCSTYTSVETFLNSLSPSASWRESVDAIRSGIQKMCDDVDHVMVGLNISWEEGADTSGFPAMTIGQYINQGQKGSARIAVDAGRPEQRPIDRLMQNLRRSEFPETRYHPPQCFEYYSARGGYLGAIILWRDVGKPVISASTLQTMERLTSFLAYLLSTIILCYHAANVSDHAFGLALERLILERGLTVQERRIVTMQLLGYSYEETAVRLNVSVNTVRYHLKSIYRKSHARSLQELFSKYFTPRHIELAVK